MYRQTTAWPTADQLIGMSNEELGLVDPVVMNLAVAKGIPSLADLDIGSYVQRADAWAELVRLATKKTLRQRAKQLNYREYSENEFRILVMVTVLQRNLGVRYNLAFSQGEYDARDSRNLFIHGLLGGHGGTCVTMPVLYAAIGRRLGYPIKLVNAKEHTFCRWDDPSGERFNIEATSSGFNSHPDDYYLSWPKPITSTLVSQGHYLRSLNPRSELALFFHSRGLVCLDNLNTPLALESCRHAAELDPLYEGDWAIATLIHGVLSTISARQFPMTLPLSELVQLAIPRARQQWEQWAVPIAASETIRILSHFHQDTVAVRNL